MEEKCTAALKKSFEVKPATRMAILDDSDDESDSEVYFEKCSSFAHEKMQDLKGKNTDEKEEGVIEEIFNPMLNLEEKQSSSKNCLIEEISSTRFAHT